MADAVPRRFRACSGSCKVRRREARPQDSGRSARGRFHRDDPAGTAPQALARRHGSPVPVPPALVRLVLRHVDQHRTTPDGCLFRGLYRGTSLRASTAECGKRPAQSPSLTLRQHHCSRSARMTCGAPASPRDSGQAPNPSALLSGLATASLCCYGSTLTAWTRENMRPFAASKRPSRTPATKPRRQGQLRGVFGANSH